MHDTISHRDEPDCGLLACYWHGAVRRSGIAERNRRGHWAAGHDVQVVGDAYWCVDCVRWASERPLCSRCGEILGPSAFINGFDTCGCQAGRHGYDA
jgi:hypothetical protein